MDRLRVMEVFVAVVEAGSLAAAGRRLGMSPPAVTRAVAALEARLGARLLNRTTRSLAATEAGLRFLEGARRLLAEVEAVELAAAGREGRPVGHLRVTAPLTFGRSQVTPVLMSFLKTYEQVTASLVLLDRVANLVEEGFDVAVRIAPLPDSTLVARRVGEVRRLLVASPAYLAVRGAPGHPGELKAHDTVALAGPSAGREWRFVDHGRGFAVSPEPRLEVNDTLAALMAAERGEGITTAFSYLADPLLADGRLVEVLAAFATPAVPVHLVHPHARLVAPKVRAFVDFAAPRLKRALSRGR